MIYMFEELFGQNVVFSWDDDVLWRFIITVKRNYRDVIYHNFTHAFKVTYRVVVVVVAAASAVVVVVVET